MEFGRRKSRGGLNPSAKTSGERGESLEANSVFTGLTGGCATEAFAGGGIELVSWLEGQKSSLISTFINMTYRTSLRKRKYISNKSFPSKNYEFYDEAARLYLDRDPPEDCAKKKSGLHLKHGLLSRERNMKYRIDIRIILTKQNKQSEPSVNWLAQLEKAPSYRDLERIRLRMQEHSKIASRKELPRKGGWDKNHSPFSVDGNTLTRTMNHNTQSKNHWIMITNSITDELSPQKDFRNRKYLRLTSLTNFPSPEKVGKSFYYGFKAKESIKIASKHNTEITGEQGIHQVSKENETNISNHRIFVGISQRIKNVRNLAEHIAGNARNELHSQETLDSSYNFSEEDTATRIKISGTTSKSPERKSSENLFNVVLAELESQVGLSSSSLDNITTVSQLKLVLADLIEVFTSSYEHSLVNSHDRTLKSFTVFNKKSGMNPEISDKLSETNCYFILEMSNEKNVKNIFGKKNLTPETAEEQAMKRAKASTSVFFDGNEEISDFEDDSMGDGNLSNNQTVNNTNANDQEGARGGTQTVNEGQDSLDTRIDEIDNEIEQNVAQDRIDEANRRNAVAEAQEIALKAEERAADMERKYRELLYNMEELKRASSLNNNNNQAGTAENYMAFPPSSSTAHGLMQMTPSPPLMQRTHSRTDPNMIGTSEMVVMHRDYPDRLVDDVSFSSIEKKLNATAAKHAQSKSKIKVIIDGISNKQGAIIVSCRTPGTADWIKSIADKVLDMHSCTIQEARLEPAFMVWVPDNEATYEGVISAFKSQDIEVQQWSLLKASSRKRIKQLVSLTLREMKLKLNFISLSCGHASRKRRCGGTGRNAEGTRRALRSH